MMYQSQTEGVIKFQLDFEKSGPVDPALVKGLSPWRKKLYELELIGQNPDLYGGYSYGNVSRRIKHGSKTFIITGSQTSHLPELEIDHYSKVLSCDVEKNRLVAQGPVPPSSEALTHFAIYIANGNINYVFHIHSPVIWKNAKSLGIPQTSPDVAYGTPEMANEIKQLFQSDQLDSQNIVAMGGHRDGIIGFGKTADQAGQSILDALKNATECRNIDTTPG